MITTDDGLHNGQGWKMLVAEWVPLFVSTLTVLVRFIARVGIEEGHWLKRWKFRRLHIEDYMMAMSVTVQYGHAIAQTVAVERGLGHHIWDLDDASIISVTHMIEIIKGFSIIPSCLGRVSIALYQLRLLPPFSSRWKIAPLMVVMIFDPCVNLITIIQIYSQCGGHLAGLWDPTVRAIAHCENPHIETRIGYGQSGTNSLCDLILSLFPIVILWDLQMPPRRKIQLYAILSTSYLALIASIIKTIRIGELSASSDFTYNFVSLQIWVSIEVNTIITTGSFPALFPLLKYLVQRKSKTVAKYYTRSTSETTTAGPRKKDSTELSILKVRDFTVSVDEEEGGQEAVKSDYYPPEE